MKKIIILSTVLFALSLHAISQIAGNAIYNQATNNNNYSTDYNRGDVDLRLDNFQYDFSSKLLEANVMINVPATAYVAIFSLTQNGKSIEESDSAMAVRIHHFERTLGRIGIDHKQVFIDPISLVPTYEVEVENKKFSRTYNEVPSGFEIKKNVHIEFRDHEQINAIISAAAQAEIYDLVKVDYSVAEMNKILDGLREQALKILFSKKDIIDKAGLNTRFKVVREKYGSVYPLERYSEYYAYKTGVTPAFASTYKKNAQQQQKIQYNYAEKNKTVYYSKVSDKQFDLVINPVVGEPQVQIYLTLKGQYEVYDPEKEIIQQEYEKKIRDLEMIERELRIEEKRRDIELKGKLPAKPATAKAPAKK